MEPNINDISRRLQELETEYQVTIRQSRNVASQVESEIAKLTDAVCETVERIDPSITAIRQYTADDIIRNEHGELESIKSLVSNLTTYINERLSFYEEQL